MPEWYVDVKLRDTGKPWTLFLRGPQQTSAEVAQHIAIHYRNVTFESAVPAITPPPNGVKRVPSEFYETGAIRAVEQELMESRGYDPRKLITRKTIPRR